MLLKCLEPNHPFLEPHHLFLAPLYRLLLPRYPHPVELQLFTLFIRQKLRIYIRFLTAEKIYKIYYTTRYSSIKARELNYIYFC